jgi:hypothetical protein
MKQLFGGVYAAAPLGIFLRKLTQWPHPAGDRRCCADAWSRWPGGRRSWTASASGRFVDIDLRCARYGHAKQGDSLGHTKIAGKTVPRRGLSPLTVSICTERAAPVLAGVRLRAGRAGSAKGTASMVTETINTATAAGAWAKNILVRGDCAYCTARSSPRRSRPGRGSPEGLPIGAAEDEPLVVVCRAGEGFGAVASGSAA